MVSAKESREVLAQSHISTKIKTPTPFPSWGISGSACVLGSPTAAANSLRAEVCPRVGPEPSPCPAFPGPAPSPPSSQPGFFWVGTSCVALTHLSVYLCTCCLPALAGLPAVAGFGG